MNDNYKYKLLHAVDPNKIDVPINEKFSKLTLSSNKKKSKQQKSSEDKNKIKRTASRNLIRSFCTEIENNNNCDRDNTMAAQSYSNIQNAETQLNTMLDTSELLNLNEDQSDFMEALQVSVDEIAEKSANKDTQIDDTELMTSLEDSEDEVIECITIPDSSISETEEKKSSTDEFCAKISEVPQSGHTADGLLPCTLSNDKVDRIEAFLRDVSIERKKMHYDENDENTKIMLKTESDLTRSMSSFEEIIEPVKNFADNDTELNTDTDTDTSTNEHFNSSSTPKQKTRNDTVLNETVTIPETSTESESLDEEQTKYQTQPQQTYTSHSTDTSESFESTRIALKSISISAKVNINIQITGLESNSSEYSPPESVEGSDKKQSESTKYEQQCQKTQSEPARLQENSENTENAENTDNEDGGFLTHAEKLLNQLYGSSWQTPEVIGTLKRTCRTACEKPKNTKIDDQKEPPKELNKKPANVEESMLADFSIFRRNIDKNLDSTHLSIRTPIRKKCNSNKKTAVVATEPRRRPNVLPPKPLQKKPAVKEHIHKARWRQLVDPDSDSDGALASDEELNASLSDSEGSDCFQSISPACSTSSEFVNKHKQKPMPDICAPSPKSYDEANKENADANLDDILRTCRPEPKPKLLGTPKPISKRKLFTPNVGYEDEVAAEQLIKNVREVGDELLEDLENVYMPGTPVHKRLQEIKKKNNAEPKKGGGEPIFKTPTLPTNNRRSPRTPKPRLLFKDKLKDLQDVKYGFLKSLEESVPTRLCDPDALLYRDSYRTKKEELACKLFEMYNRELFNNMLDVPLTWNKKLTNTAGRCLNRQRMGERTCAIELSEKVLTSADRLRCTLIHELCHAATWILNGEGGHGSTWKSWAYKANQKFTDLPKIDVCHQYEIEYKYTYKCTLCAAKSHAHSKSKKVDEIRCRYCQGAIEIFLNKKTKNGNIVATPVKEATGFAKFVQENYKQYKRPDLKHADVMKILSNEFSNFKVAAAAGAK